MSLNTYHCGQSRVGVGGVSDGAPSAEVDEGVDVPSCLAQEDHASSRKIYIFMKKNKNFTYKYTLRPHQYNRNLK